MGIFGGFSSGGGFFGSGGKTDSGNTTSSNSTFAPNVSFANDSNGNTSNAFAMGNNSSGNTVNVTSTDFGAINAATGILDKSINTVVDTVSGALSSVGSMFSDSMANNLSVVDSALFASTEANNLIAGIASDSAANSAFLSDSVINSTGALASQFGSDVAYLADSSMTNNAILTDKVIDVTEVLASQHQQSLNDFGTGLKDAQAQYSADVGYLSNQSIQANAELTSQYMMGLNDNSMLVQDSLITLAQLQERGLDSALEVAGNVALDDSVEGLKEIFKYLAIGGAIVGVAYAFNRG